MTRNDRPNNKGGGGWWGSGTATETTTIKLETTDNHKLILVAPCAKKGQTTKFRFELESLFARLNLNSHSNFYIVAGDFNAKHKHWANKVNDERGMNLQDWLNSNDFKYRIKLLHSDSPSFPRNESYIDLLLVDARLECTLNNSDKLYTTQVMSDHTALVTQISIPDQNIILNSNRDNKAFNFSGANWEKFQNILRPTVPNIKPDSNLSIPQIEEQIHNIA